MDCLSFFSKRGLRVDFPGRSFLEQGTEAAGAKYNATLGVAVEDDKTPMRLASLEKTSLDPKDIFPYVSSYGKMAIRQLWQEQMRTKNPSLNSPISLPVVTASITHGLMTSAFLFLEEKETLFSFDPFWENYSTIFEIGFGVKMKTFPIFRKGSLNLQALKKINKKKINLLLNFPHNPTGYTPTKSEVEELVSIIKGWAEAGSLVVVIIDDAYFGCTYEDVYKESIFVLLSSLHENVLAIKLDGASKEDYAWGLRIGFVTYGFKGGESSYKLLQNKTAGAVRSTVASCSHLAQSLLIAAYNSPTYLQEKRANYLKLESRYKKARECVKDKKYRDCFSPLPFNSGYFFCLELKKGLDGDKIRKLLLSKYDTGVISFSNLIRVAYSSLREDEIPIVLENIYTACKEIV